MKWQWLVYKGVLVIDCAYGNVWSPCHLTWCLVLPRKTVKCGKNILYLGGVRGGGSQLQLKYFLWLYRQNPCSATPLLFMESTIHAWHYTHCRKVWASMSLYLECELINGNEEKSISIECSRKKADLVNVDAHARHSILSYLGVWNNYLPASPSSSLLLEALKFQTFFGYNYKGDVVEGMGKA